MASLSSGLVFSLSLSLMDEMSKLKTKQNLNALLMRPKSQSQIQLSELYLQVKPFDYHLRTVTSNTVTSNTVTSKSLHCSSSDSELQNSSVAHTAA